MLLPISFETENAFMFDALVMHYPAAVQIVA